ncbi:uncharacterized protein H6S33_008403 [Morchella sextelata]|uniref:uncharacterized protein n=1 Tax=Morchella sextelata TaxID=1174677 RepID=UPI001D040FE7|nr:uncharacterized protein H6S33_008403 [Morchella sextelata]KAH0602753.1 hypothetical protein H6S33_008403 [Morchella sextelata]
MAGTKKKAKLPFPTRSKLSAPSSSTSTSKLPTSPAPAVSTVHASGKSSLPATSTSESNLHVHSSSRVSPARTSTPAAAPKDADPPSASAAAAAAASSSGSPATTITEASSKKQKQQIQNQPASSSTPSTIRGGGQNTDLPANDVEKPTSRWFLRTGTWPRGGSRKSAPVTSVASEHVSGTTSPTPSIKHGKTSAPTREEETRDSSVPAATTITTPSAMITKSATPSMRAPSLHPSEAEATETQGDSKDAVEGSENNETSDASAAQQPAPAAGSYWFGWWYGYGPPPETQAPPAPKSEVPEVQPEEAPAVEVVVAREPTPPPPPPPRLPTPPPPPPPVRDPTPEPIAPETTEVPALDGAADNKAKERPRSWFGLWGGGPYPETQTVQEAPAESAETVLEQVPQESSSSAAQAATRSEPAAPAVPAVEVAAKQSETHLLGAHVDSSAPLSLMPSATETVSSTTSAAPARASSGWAFWSRDRSKPTNPALDSNASSTTTVGQLAVANTPSASNPQKAKVKDIPAPVPAPPPAPVNEPKVARSVSNLREESRPITPKKSDASMSAAAAVVPVTPQPAAASASTTVPKTPTKTSPANHVFPEFESCYHKMRQPSMFCQVTKVLKSQVPLFKNQPPPPKKHLYLAPAPLRIKKAVAIGVHGFFPMRLVRTVLGEPTGTSIRFANSAAGAIKRWAEKNNVEVEIEKIALEGEGKVGDRVETLWKLLSNWMEHVKNADFVLMAAHSQGVVVGVQLLARLIEEGCVKEKARVGFTAMAGINLGPFYHLPTTILTGSAKELFEFQKPDSAPSQKYIQALEVILRHNVRVLYVGSIDDQLVPLESSTFANVTHPYIFRAVFVDGRVHAPDFLSHLVGFAMKLRNQGISDHGLIRELSNPLAGSLYGGEGHSRIYDDVQVYDLGVRHALETTECEGVEMKVEPFELPTNTNNPFFLPWSMRGMLEEPHVRNRLHEECMQLLEQFENWKPTSKVLKDVKFRLEGIRSKL